MKMKGSPNLCDALGADACNLKCGRSTCQVRIALAGRTRFVIAILGVTTGANTAGEISMQYKPPSSCWSQPAAYQVFDVKPTNVFKWAAVSAGRMPDLDCEDAKVGRCRLTVSNPVLKAHMVSALETRIS